jgi:hypothetical protein
VCIHGVVGVCAYGVRLTVSVCDVCMCVCVCVAIPGSNMTVALVFIDTAGTSDPKDTYSSPDAPDSQQAADDEWEWIDQTLAGYSKPGSGVGWIFVAGHYPGM